MSLFSKEGIKKEFREFISENTDIKSQRAEAIKLSSDRKYNNENNYLFDFKVMEYKVDKGDYPLHPSALLENDFYLTITTNKGVLETVFKYNYKIKDYLSSDGISNPRIEMLDLVEFQGFINDEEIKLDKATAKKISSNYKLDQKEIKRQFDKSFKLELYTNYKKAKQTLDEINELNRKYKEFSDMMSKSDELSKLVKKYNHPIQKIISHNDILFMSEGYLNEFMRKDIKKLLDSYEKELWSIDDKLKHQKISDNNKIILNSLKKYSPAKLVYMSRGSEVKVDI